MKRFVTAIALCCILSASALAGDVPSVGAPSPNSEPAITATNDPGDIQTPGKALSSEALSALLSVLSFLAA
jgi:hypothetical protein